MQKMKLLTRPFTRAVAKGFLFGISTLIVLVIITAISGGLILRSKYKLFLDQAGMSHQSFKQLVGDGIEANTFENQTEINVLLLGLDSLMTRSGSPPLSDTIIITHLNLEDPAVSSISLPRDLWNQPYQTKINALYTYGHQRDSDNPKEFPQTVLGDMTGLEIDYTLPITMDQISTLIDLVGGVQVEVKQSFRDEQFPRPDIDVTQVTDPKLLYKTIEFEAGPQQMTGSRALEYIRSRKSEDDEGNDLARESRQQQVILSLVQKLSDPMFYYRNPEIAGRLLKFYQENWGSHLPLKDLISLANTLRMKDVSHLKYSNIRLTEYPEDQEGVIYHPPEYLYQNQWVYIVHPNADLIQYINQNL